MPTVALRLLALLAFILAATVLARAAGLLLGGDPQEGALRLIARLAWGAALAWVGWLAWRRPRGRSERLRRRVLRVLAVLASEELQRDYAESTPSVPAPEALLADWERAILPVLRPAEPEVVTPAERSELAALDRDLVALREALPSARDAEQGLAILRADPAWRAVRERAAATAGRLLSPAARATAGD
jgi:hypothetical protein